MVSQLNVGVWVSMPKGDTSPLTFRLAVLVAAPAEMAVNVSRTMPARVLIFAVNVS